MTMTNDLTNDGSAVVKDRILASKRAAEELGWADVTAFSGAWSDLQALKDRWLRTIEGFHKLFVDFIEYDDTRSDPEKARRQIADDLKMLSKPSSDFATLAAMSSFRTLIDCSDDYYQAFTDTIQKVADGGHLDAIPWTAADAQEQIEALWDNRAALADECRAWLSQDVKPVCVRLSPDTPDGRYTLLEVD